MVENSENHFKNGIDYIKQAIHELFKVSKEDDTEDEVTEKASGLILCLFNLINLEGMKDPHILLSASTELTKFTEILEQQGEKSILNIEVLSPSKTKHIKGKIVLNEDKNLQH